MSNAARDFEAFVDSLGLRYFKGKEFTPYWSRKRGGVMNSVPPRTLWQNILPTLLVADELRHRIGSPCTVNSSYRSPAYNKAVGGEKASYHMKFMALDLTFAKGSAEDWHSQAVALRGHRFVLPDGRVFPWRGGIGLYPKSNFIHIDTRGYDADWKG
jgi:uncharacterized protein YcbK (DUF882 family)